ncbi:hypothetical protein FRC09_007642 [Ceratobasidium sp. 395]|nr:hypothetical protein FRC09_007642 [Ceratobasidium sp. 395]
MEHVDSKARVTIEPLEVRWELWIVISAHTTSEDLKLKRETVKQERVEGQQVKLEVIKQEVAELLKVRTQAEAESSKQDKGEPAGQEEEAENNADLPIENKHGQGT